MKERLENPKKYIPFNDALEKLGSMQYVSRFVNPHPKLHEDGTPYFDDIRVTGNPDDYYNLFIHPDDVIKFIEKWLDYKKKTTHFYAKNKVEDFLPS
jgi:hypothetical protein